MPISDLARELTRVNPSPRPWQMPFAAGLTTAIPVALGAYFGDLRPGLIGALGTITFVYIANTTLQRRLITLMSMGFAMTACFTLGLVAGMAQLAAVPVIFAVALLVSIGCRYLRQGPPAALFPVMACAIGLFAKADWPDIPTRVGLLFMGTALATTTGFFYSLYILSRRPAPPAPEPPAHSFESLAFEPCMIALAAALALGAAMGLGIEKPFWAPVSALTVIQSPSLRSVWTRQTHRILGTGLGMLLAWGLLAMAPGPWAVVGIIAGLTFVIEMTITRHFGLATLFITPMAILLAQAPSLPLANPGLIALARFEDTLVGCAAAVLVGLAMHSPTIRAAARRWAKRWIEG